MKEELEVLKKLVDCQGHFTEILKFPEEVIEEYNVFATTLQKMLNTLSNGKVSAYTTIHTSNTNNYKWISPATTIAGHPNIYLNKSLDTLIILMDQSEVGMGGNCNYSIVLKKQGWKLLGNEHNGIVPYFTNSIPYCIPLSLVEELSINYTEQ